MLTFLTFHIKYTYLCCSIKTFKESIWFLRIFLEKWKVYLKIILDLPLNKTSLCDYTKGWIEIWQLGKKESCICFGYLFKATWIFSLKSRKLHQTAYSSRMTYSVWPQTWREEGMKEELPILAKFPLQIKSHNMGQ